jgi:hypothetical protein
MGGAMDIRFILSAIALFVFLGWLIPSPVSWLSRRALEKRHAKEIQALRNHLHLRLEIDSTGVARLKEENERLRQMVQNLRMTNCTLSAKPNAAELRLLRVYDRAIQIMEGQFPLLIPTWRALVGHAEKEMAQVDQGIAPLVKRVFRVAGRTGRPLPAGPGQAKLLDSRRGEEESKS